MSHVLTNRNVPKCFVRLGYIEMHSTGQIVAMNV
jgi:hypothetical protein